MCSLIGVVEPDYISKFVSLQHMFANAEGAQVVRPHFSLPTSHGLSADAFMGPDAIERATARISAAPASLTRACLTSLHQFFCPAAVHNARVAGEDDVPHFQGKTITYYYLEK